MSDAPRRPQATDRRPAESGQRRRRPPGPYVAPRVEALLRQVVDHVETARPMPLSTSVMVNRDELLELLEEAMAHLPDELRSARWLLREREEFLAKVRREGDEILEVARSRAARMVERTEVVKASERRARQIVAEAEDHARQRRNEVDDYIDHKLAGFEALLDKTRAQVGQGRQRLAGRRPEPADQVSPGGESPDGDGADPSSPAGSGGGTFFDQDQV